MQENTLKSKKIEFQDATSGRAPDGSHIEQIFALWSSRWDDNHKEEIMRLFMRASR